MNRRDFLRTIGVSPIIFGAGASATLNAYSQVGSGVDLWSKPRDIWIVRPESGEGGRYTYWVDGMVIDSEYRRICRLMRDLRENVTVAMSIGLLNFQYAIQQGIRFYFRDQPLILTDAHRTPRTNARIENAAHKSQHLKAAANDGFYKGVQMQDHFRLASWFGVGGVGIYERHVHVDAGRYRRWAGSYQPTIKGRPQG